MLNSRSKQKASRSLNRRLTPLGRPGDRGMKTAHKVESSHSASVPMHDASMKASHGLTNASENMQLYAYESSVRESFDSIVPTLKQISALQHPRNGRISKAISKKKLNGITLLFGVSWQRL